ncbi:hypothetical protein [Aliikangiella sp. IMCC44632]
MKKRFLTKIRHLAFAVLCSLLIAQNEFLLAQEREQANPSQQQAKTAQQPSKSQTLIEETVLGMNVSGTKDLPNVLYIVPWKGDASEASPPEITRLVDEVYAPIDPEVFTKQVKFYRQLTQSVNNAEKTE